MDKEGLVKKLLETAVKLVTLEIVTVVGTYDGKTNTLGPSSKMMRTRLVLTGVKVASLGLPPAGFFGVKRGFSTGLKAAPSQYSIA